MNHLQQSMQELMFEIDRTPDFGLGILDCHQQQVVGRHILETENHSLCLLHQHSVVDHHNYHHNHLAVAADHRHNHLAVAFHQHHTHLHNLNPTVPHHNHLHILTLADHHHNHLHNLLYRHLLGHQVLHGHHHHHLYHQEPLYQNTTSTTKSTP